MIMLYWVAAFCTNQRRALKTFACNNSALAENTFTPAAHLCYFLRDETRVRLEAIARARLAEGTPVVFNYFAKNSGCRDRAIDLKEDSGAS